MSVGHEIGVPIGPMPGDLLMIARAAVEQLEEVRDTCPDDGLTVEGIAVATMASIGYWLTIRSPRVTDPARQETPTQ